jgi:hypothetical protein
LYQQKKRRAGRDLALHVVEGGVRGLVVDRLHALAGERAGVLDRLPADPAEARIFGRIVLGRRLAPEHTARAERFPKARVPGVVEVLRLLLGVQVVEVAEELVEPVHGRQIFVAIAEVVLAELPGGVAKRLQELRDRRVDCLQPDRRGRHADLGQPRAQRRLAGDEARPACRAALLGVVVDEHHALAGDPVDVRRLVAHQPVRVGADVRKPDVVAEDDEDVRSLSRRLRLRLRAPHRGDRTQRRGCCQCGAAEKKVAPADAALPWYLPRNSRPRAACVLSTHHSAPSPPCYRSS